MNRKRMVWSAQKPSRKPVAYVLPAMLLDKSRVEETESRLRQQTKMPNYKYPFIAKKDLGFYKPKKEKRRLLISEELKRNVPFYWNLDLMERQGAIERLQIVGDLVKQGFEVRIAVSREQTEAPAIKAFLDEAKKAGAKIAITKSSHEYPTDWMRDRFSYIAGFRFAREPVVMGGKPRIKRFSEIPKQQLEKTRKAFSALGEGGTVVEIGKGCVLISEKVARESQAEIGFLKGKGVK
ncbi:MAG: hypothetical protein QXK06_05600, partial [Candidatus Diapherotrites archaeon]